MQQPSVCAVCITANRENFTRQAIADFRAQSYPNKYLVVWDTSDTPKPHTAFIADMRENEYYIHDSERLVIGQLRNRANSYACSGEGFAAPEILIHLDSDDRNHSRRFEEQVALLQSSGADAVGFNELLFWRKCVYCTGGKTFGPSNLIDKPEETECWSCHGSAGDAWLYSNVDQRYPPGSSLCFWRHVWERKPFAATSAGEDLKFCTGLNVVSVSSLSFDRPVKDQPGADPMMMCRIHPGNTSTAYKPSSMEAEARKRNGMWKRVPAWDQYCQEQFNER